LEYKKQNTNNLFHILCVCPETTQILPEAFPDAMDNKVGACGSVVV
jgi:hypothetical protein